MRNLTPSTLAALPATFGPAAELERAFNARRSELASQERATTLTWMAFFPRPRSRDGRGRFLSKAWLDRAEAFTTADLAWFRSPLGEV